MTGLSRNERRARRDSTEAAPDLKNGETFIMSLTTVRRRDCGFLTVKAEIVRWAASLFSKRFSGWRSPRAVSKRVRPGRLQETQIIDFAREMP